MQDEHGLRASTLEALQQIAIIPTTGPACEVGITPPEARMLMKLFDLLNHTEEVAENLWMKRLERVTAVICWDCREVSYTEDFWALNGCNKCGAKGYALPLVFREAHEQQNG